MQFLFEKIYLNSRELLIRIVSMLIKLTKNSDKEKSGSGTFRPPITRALQGVLKNKKVDEIDYKTHLEEKCL